MRVALIQTDVVYANPQKNLERFIKLVQVCVKNRPKPDVIVLPEMWNSSYALKEIALYADKSGSPSARAMGDLAGELGVNIVAGSVADLREGEIYNTSYVFDRRGKAVATYSKVHLFGLMKEKDYLTAGTSRTIFELDGVLCGVIICYDLRFPELARALALDGAKVLFVPAQWPHPRFHPWNILLQARAIENQLYMVGVNRVGEEGKARFFGNSMVVDPMGEVLVRGSEKEEMLFCDLDLAKVEKSREYLTCYQDRAPQVYK